MKNTNTEPFLQHPMMEKEVKKARETTDKIQQIGLSSFLKTFMSLYVSV